MSKNNLAYDLTKYEDVAPERAPEIKVRKQRAANVGSAPKIFAAAAAAGLLLGAVIYGKVETASIHAEITAQERIVRDLDSENVRMKSELEKKTSLNYIESYAVETLGMQKLDKSQIEYVSISNGSVADIPESDENVFVRIKNSLDDFLEYIRG